MSDLPVKAVDQDPLAKPSAAAGGSSRASKVKLGAAAIGVLLLGLGIGLAIGLPLVAKARAENNRSAGAVQLDASAASNGDGSTRELAGQTRKFYLRAEPIDWDFAPSGINRCSGKPFDEAQELYVSQGMGSKLRKAVYRAYTDASFKTPVERPAEEQHLGLLGPPLHAEVGDTIEVVMQNGLAFPINLVAGGVKAMDAPPVNPGDTVTARWSVPLNAGPTAEDGPSTSFWVYRSNLDPTRDTQAGLAGPLVISRRGGLGANGKPSDVDRELFLMLQVFNEGNSPFYETNAAAHAKALAAMSEEDAAESAMKMSINGFTFCHIPGLNMTVNERVRWYVTSLGSEDAIHTAHWHGISFKTEGKHVDQVPVQASTSYVLDAYVDNPGTWLFHCHLTDHIHGGMMALFHISGEPPAMKLEGKERRYYIGAVEEVWDYAPFGGEMCGGTLVNFSDNAKTFLEPGPDRVGRRYIKAMYTEFTDDTFTQRKRRAPEWEHLGVMGPVLRGVVGDTLLVTFKNMMKSNHSVSMHPHGVWYDKSSEGSPYADGLPRALGDALAPGQSVEYRWLVPERSGPGPRDLSSVMWMYHSHVNEAADPWAGLMGALIVTTPANANDDATPKDVKREYVLAFSILNEGESILAAQNWARGLPRALTANETALEELLADPGFQESNLMHSINGYMYCNLPGLDFVQGDSARLYFMALGSTADMHTPNSAESHLFVDGHRKQSVQLLPGGTLAVDTTPSASGKGLLQCHVYDHISAGMSAIYNVKHLGIVEAPADATVREYFIAAEPVTWDYAPLGFDGCSGNAFTPDQEVFVKTTNETMGSVYRKALFREYTDATFKTRKPSPPENGILGPMLRAEVGDKIVVHFLNRLPFNASMQTFGGLVPIGNTTAYQVNIGGSEAAAEAAAPQVATAAAAPAAAAPAPAASISAAGRRLLRGVQAAAAGLVSPGRRLSQITAAEAEAEAVIAQSVENLYALGAVPTGGRVKYEWFVPDSAGPASRDGPSVLYAYVSGVDHIKHINAGLVGPLVVYRKGKLADPGVDAEIPLLFNIQNEMQSAFFDESLALAQNSSGLVVDRMAIPFPESNLMHTINGFIYCNGPTLQLAAGSRVRWMVMGFGSEADMHSPVFEGQDVTYAGVPVYAVGLMPSNTFAIDMAASAPGTWQIYCNILDHITAGMVGRMVVS